MTYSIFMMKSTIKNKANWFLLLIIPILSVILLFVNLNAQSKDTMYFKAAQNVQNNRFNIKLVKEQKESSKFLNGFKTDLKANQLIIDSINKSEWLSAYKHQTQLNNYNLSIELSKWNACFNHFHLITQLRINN